MDFTMAISTHPVQALLVALLLVRMVRLAVAQAKPLLRRPRIMRPIRPLLAAIACLVFAADVSADPQDFDHCITEEGVDLNELYGLSDQIVLPFCTEVEAGRRWTVGARWFVAPVFEAVPEGFVPAGETPLEDFEAKLVAVKYVIDGGTAQEKVSVVANDRDLFVASDEEMILVNTVTLGGLRPLSAGEHTVAVYWVFSAMHCDGFGAVVEENCFPPGETLYRVEAFDVVPRND